MFLSGKPWQALASLRLQNQKLFEWGEKVQKHVVKISTYSSHLSWCVWSPQYACIIMVRLLTVHAPCCTILLSGHMVPQPVHAQWGNSPASKVKKKSINWEFKHIVMLLWKNDPTSEVILIAPVQKKNFCHKFSSQAYLSLLLWQLPVQIPSSPGRRVDLGKQPSCWSKRRSFKHEQQTG